MNKIKLLITAAFAIGIGSAFAFKIAQDPISAEGKRPSNGVCTSATTVESDCDPNLTSGIQCTVLIEGQSTSAYQSGTMCTIDLFRPNE